MVFKLAARNLRRNLRRTLITLVAIAGGLAIVIVSSGLGDGAHGQMIDKGLGALAGHVVVQGAGWQQDRELDQVVPDSAGVQRRLQDALPEAQVLRRGFVQGLLTSPTGSVGVGLSAVDPDVEVRVDDLDTKLVAGTYLDGEDARAIYLGAVVAQTLDVGVGDKVVLMLQHGPDIASRLFRVQGLFRTGLDAVDGFTGQITLPAAAELLGGPDVQQVAVFFPDTRHLKRDLERVRAVAAGPAVEVLPWQEAMPELHQFVVLDDGGLYVMLIVVALIVALGILNTVLMSVLERTREFGVMLALGVTPGLLRRVVLAETLLLGLLSVVVGVAMGLLGNYPSQVYGIDLTQYMGEGGMEAGGVQMDSMMYADLQPDKVLLFSLLTLALTLGAALYPAWKAGRLEPTDAMNRR